jgi:hypothetical protein
VLNARAILVHDESLKSGRVLQKRKLKEGNEGSEVVQGVLDGSAGEAPTMMGR